jgi:hypothetical protein
MPCPPPTPMPVNTNNSPHPDSPYNGLNGIDVNTLPSENIINNNSYVDIFLDSDSNEILMEVDVFKDRILDILRDIKKSMISQLEDYNLEY